MDHCLKFMCDLIKVRSHPTRPEYLIITDEMEEIEINSIGGVVSAPLKFKEHNGQVVPLTQEVFVHFLYRLYIITRINLAQLYLLQSYGYFLTFQSVCSNDDVFLGNYHARNSASN